MAVVGEGADQGGGHHRHRVWRPGDLRVVDCWQITYPTMLIAKAQLKICKIAVIKIKVHNSYVQQLCILQVLQPTDLTKIEEFYCAHDSHSGGGDSFHEAITKVLIRSCCIYFHTKNVAPSPTAEIFPV